MGTKTRPVRTKYQCCKHLRIKMGAERERKVQISGVITDHILMVHTAIKKGGVIAEQRDYMFKHLMGITEKQLFNSLALNF